MGLLRIYLCNVWFGWIMEGIETLELSGRPVAERITAAMRQRLGSHREEGDPVPCLASVAIGTEGPFLVYQRQQKRSVEKAGLSFREVILPELSSNTEVREALRSLNDDRTVHGIILQHPLPHGLDFFSLVSTISPEKDVDGVGINSLGRLAARRPIHVPAVAMAAIDILKHYGLSPSGKRAVVLGRSETVGIPTVLLLLMKGEWGNATVTVAHSGTPDLDDVVREAEVVISCTGKPGIVNRGNVAKLATVVDVGLSTVPDPSKPGGVRVVGDTDGGNLKGWAGAVTPVPGGVGPVTVAELLNGLVLGWELVLGRGAGYEK
jgi:methylenetetrahydrofolate dehydrogenase (NADP+)/methenyltetrahydrofolate cyclohydrolase